MIGYNLYECRIFDRNIDLTGERLERVFITRSELPLKYEHNYWAEDLGSVIILPTTASDGIAVIRTQQELNVGDGLSIGGMGSMIDSTSYSINLEEVSVVKYPAIPEARILSKLN